ncbi:MAG TPA: PhzF family phenazine biosynthesis protein, partial [Limnochordia bacterium]|nr:PhzF family phenazine biosynthesis protein [Limnochordia bacterium]
SPDRYLLEHVRPEFGPALPVVEVAAALGTAPGSVGPGAPQVVSTGLPFAIVPIRTLAVLSKLRPPGVERFCAARGLIGLLLFCAECVDAGNDLHARMFAGDIGLYEDPATGSAARCLAAYLLRRGAYGEGPLRARLEQGYEMGRPSLLWLEAEGDPEAPRIRVAGQVHAIAEGRLCEAVL